MIKSRFGYTLLLWALLPFALIRLVWRARRQPDYLRHFAERFGFYGERPGRPVIWLHAVSVGETRAAEPLIEALRREYPDHRVLITHMTPTGRETGAALYGDDVSRCYLPYDFPFAVRRFLDHFRPEVGALMETEIWFNLIHECRARGTPIYLVNARLSQRSAAKYARFPDVVRNGLQQLTAIAAQTRDDARRLESLGAAEVRVCGNLKFDIDPPAEKLALGRQWRTSHGARPVLLAASTRDGEEALLLDALVTASGFLNEGAPACGERALAPPPARARGLVTGEAGRSREARQAPSPAPDGFANAVSTGPAANVSAGRADTLPATPAVCGERALAPPPASGPAANVSAGPSPARGEGSIPHPWRPRATGGNGVNRPSRVTQESKPSAPNSPPPDLLFVIVPRHPQRFDAVAALLEKRGVRYQRRSENRAVAATTQVLLGDSMGELFAYYTACDIAFIGGSLLPFGGQNLIEACMVGRPVIVGPHTYNFSEATDAALQAGAALQVDNAQQIFSTAARLFEDEASVAAIGEAGRKFAAEHRGATAKLLALMRW